MPRNETDLFGMSVGARAADNLVANIMDWKLSDDPLGQLEIAIAEDDMNEAYNVLFEVTRCGHDLALAYAATRRCLFSGNRILRSVGVRALGDIAKVFDTLDERFKEILEEALVDPDREIRFPAAASAMDLYSFLHWQFRNWTPKGEPIPMEERFEDLPIGQLGPVMRGNDLVQHHYGNQQRKAKRLPLLPPLPY